MANDRLDVTSRKIPNLQNKMNWKIYHLIMNYYTSNDYRTLRLRIAIFLLSVTRARIGDILVLKVKSLSTLQEEFLIEIGGQTLFIQNQKIRQVIRERKNDIKYIYTIKCKNDFIFTTDLNLNAKTTIRRESLTRSVNKALRFVGKNLTPPRNLSSRSFQKWE
jgi:hypothetical protein